MEIRKQWFVNNLNNESLATANMYVLQSYYLRVLKSGALLPVRSNQLFQHHGISIYISFILNDGKKKF